MIFMLMCGLILCLFPFACNQMKLSQPGVNCTFTCCEGDLCNNATSTPVQPLPSTIAPAVHVPSAVATVPTMSADTASLASVAVPTVSLPSSNTTTNTTTFPPGGNEPPPSAGVPEFTATFGAIFVGIVLASMAALG